MGTRIYRQEHNHTPQGTEDILRRKHDLRRSGKRQEYIPVTMKDIPFNAFLEKSKAEGTVLAPETHFKRERFHELVMKHESKEGHSLICSRQIKKAMSKVGQLYASMRLKKETLLQQTIEVEKYMAMATHEALMREKALKDSIAAKKRGANSEECKLLLYKLDFDHVFTKHEWDEKYINYLKRIWEEMPTPLKESLIKRLSEKKQKK